MSTIHPVLGIPMKDLNMKRIVQEMLKFKRSGDKDMSKWWALRAATYRTTEYRKFLSGVRKRDNNTCRLCKQPGTQVHHKITVWADPKKIMSRRNCILVCDTCHNQQHGASSIW